VNIHAPRAIPDALTPTGPASAIGNWPDPM
jgi:hypothetical protein